jgi:hypothetical protein
MKTLCLLFAFGSLFLLSNILTASDKPDNIQRKSTGTFDIQVNTVSNFQFYTTNYGIISLDVNRNRGGGYWPRGSQNQYLFASGLWFGAIKRQPDDPNSFRKYVEITYNPNNGKGWFVPGSIQDGAKADSILPEKNRIYFSTDFNQLIGSPISTSDGPNWPFWITDNSQLYPFNARKHDYVNDINKRNKANFPEGPQFVSDEDIVSIFKDTDLSYYDGGESQRRNLGYPLQLEIQSRIYSWKSEEMKDVVILSYLIENKSNDTLLNCWAGGVFDVDIAIATNSQNGAANDRMSYFEFNKDLNLTVGWTMTDQGERGQGFGYIGVSMLETPAIDGNGFIRHDKNVFDPKEQIGLITSRNWPIAEDKNGDDERYNYMSSKVLDGDSGPDDKRAVLATGPFNLRPGETARVAYSINFAMPAKGGECDGTLEDIMGFKKIMNNDGNTTLEYNKSLIGGLERAIDLYYNREPSSVKEDPADLTGFSISPNPATDFIEISVGTRRAVSDQNNVKIYDVFGQRVNPTPTLPASREGVRLDVSGFAPGMYFVKIGETVVKFIKL